MTEGALTTPPEALAQDNRNRIVNTWSELWKDGKDPFKDGTFQPLDKIPNTLGDYRFPLPAINVVNGQNRYSPLGWIANEAGKSEKDLKTINPYDLISFVSDYLGIPVAQVALLRAVIELAPAGNT